MFSSLGLFKETQCPEIPHCSLPNCIFAHDERSKSSPGDTGRRKTSASHRIDPEEGQNGADPSRKRRRVGKKSQDGLDLREANPDIAIAPARLDSPGIEEKPFARKWEKHEPNLAENKPKSSIFAPLRADNASTKTFSPVSDGKDAKAHVIEIDGSRASALAPNSNGALLRASVRAEALNPRMLSNPPAAHNIRMKLLTMLHDQLTRLNDELKKMQDLDAEPLVLSSSEIIMEALDEEMSIAQKSPTVYLNVIKTRIMVLKRTKIESWKEILMKKLAERVPKSIERGSNVPPPLDTGLSANEEMALLPHLKAQQEGLNKHGYITAIPNVSGREQARQGVEAAHGWEECDRCKTRFQVFPGRRPDDGALTSGGRCTYHWARPRRPEMVKGSMKPPDLMHACCNEPLGKSSGCTKADSHVFKISDPNRLALVLPFMATPTPVCCGSKRAICFDCEMGYTTCGLELIRLTATAWPDGRELLDILVRPIGEILDLNSRFSGVWPKDYASAIPYDPSTKQASDGTTLPIQITESPAKARDLLFDLLTPDTPLIGHALENDLNAARIIHPVIVDTALLFPHPRGLPLRYGLKALMKKHLGQDIQMGGSQGHDSKEDARAAGDLVRYRLGEKWQKMQREGWTKIDGQFNPPIPLGTPPRIGSLSPVKG